MFCGLHRLHQLQKETLFKHIYSIHHFIPKTTFKTTHASIVMVLFKHQSFFYGLQPETTPSALRPPWRRCGRHRGGSCTPLYPLSQLSHRYTSTHLVREGSDVLSLGEFERSCLNLEESGFFRGDEGIKDRGPWRGLEVEGRGGAVLSQSWKEQKLGAGSQAKETLHLVFSPKCHQELLVGPVQQGPCPVPVVHNLDVAYS